ncbi:DUF2530 domain-containing protein [Gardnerella sp. KA00603]|jgi:hypothetical protein|uniref:DUF2530 domain-containing protein n=2 Tax=Gardnerella vaginalis TaxID=2702 RepID=I4LZK9_GARVA|nr:DUF2530 domain-containing protein [Gardnerella vaginalis]MBF9308786.1 DUF2530 domain-containing protein [Bifidobacteriaceae bacterium NR043]MBF9353690.1 DUF2530 domain-containing protein [Bifidobacteriaceae bacterium NR044]RFT39681.1 DUF2530 domain-containing protein [Bifidobacteriaceae bacterium NR003]RIY18339.1 DUF2530 domain-containing protein [Bifidobacteriaceae bacterium WP012]EIK82399.1 hypothetical protein CGSMWGv1500E_04311 [Gardnerella vaginalis 1500E]
MKLAPIVNPDARKSTPKPLRVDLRKVFSIGTIAWLIATVVTVIIAFLHITTWFPALVCASGMIIGVLLLIWEHFDRWDYRRLGK